jgi:hypothetical protein
MWASPAIFVQLRSTVQGRLDFNGDTLFALFPYRLENSFITPTFRESQIIFPYRKYLHGTHYPSINTLVLQIYSQFFLKKKKSCVVQGRDFDWQ